MAQQMRIAQPVRADAVLQRLRQTRREVAALRYRSALKSGNAPRSFASLDRRVVGGVAHRLGDSSAIVRAGALS